MCIMFARCSSLVVILTLAGNGASFVHPLKGYPRRSGVRSEKRSIHRRRVLEQQSPHLSLLLLSIRSGASAVPTKNDGSRNFPLPTLRCGSRTFNTFKSGKNYSTSTAAAAATTPSSSSSSNTISVDDTNLQGIMYMALSALAFSVMFLGVKLYSNAPTFTLIFYRSITQAILSILTILVGKKKNSDETNMTQKTMNDTTLPNRSSSDDTWEVNRLLVMRGAFGSAAVAAFFYAIQNMPLPDAITLQFTTPVIAAMLAVPLLNEKWTRQDKVGALVCLVGVLCITRPSWLFGSGAAGAAAAAAATTTTTGTVVPTIVGLVGAAMAATAYLIVRKIGDRADANTMVLYYAIISALTAPVASKLLDSTWDVVGSPTPKELLVFSGLGVFGFLGQLYTNMGLNKCSSAATATLVTNTQIVFAFIFEATILHESISGWSLAGTALIVSYMIFVGMSKLSKEKEVP